jgi:hypothetical protein
MTQLPDPREHIKQWLNLKEFKELLSPRFRVVASTSILPMGHRGILRPVNSHKVNTALQLLPPASSLERWKERAGLGYTLIVLVQKRASGNGGA